MTTRSGPQYYPGANTTAGWYEDNWGGDAMEVNVLAVHTTEGRNLVTYGGGASAPTLTAVPNFKRWGIDWYQHFRFDTSARALVNKLGGVATNTNNVAQVELVGTCDPATRDRWVRDGKKVNVDFIFWPQAPDWALRDLAEMFAWAHEYHGVPLVAAPKWPAYPSSYANGQGQRMSFDQWNKFRGICGHMHVPENDHGDPGNIAIGRLIEMAKTELGVEDPTPPAPKPTTPKPAPPAFPGRKWFVAGANNKYVTQLGTQLKKKGFSRYHDGDGYQPGPRWTEYDRRNVQAFQRSRKELRGDADGYPGPLTWKLLFS